MDICTRCASFLRSPSDFASDTRFRLAAACALWIGLSAALPGAAGALSLREGSGTFPGAVEIEAEFGSFDDLQINGDRISDTGFLFRVRNTSYGDGGASAFASRPDGDFAERKRLTQDAVEALSDAQPFGLYAFEVELPAGAGARVSAPAGFQLRRELSDDGDEDEGRDEHDGDDDEAWVELSFRFDLARASGLLFDDAASTPSALFGTPRYGVLEFFVSTSRTELLDDLLGATDGQTGIEVSSSLAWVEGREIATRFDESCEDFDGERLRPRAELVALLQPIPEPRTAAQLALGLLLLARLGRPRCARTRPGATRPLRPS